jgi:hypothetical protein
MNAIGFAASAGCPGCTGTLLTESRVPFDCAYSLTRLPVNTPRHWVLNTRDSFAKKACGLALSVAATCLAKVLNIAYV